VPLLPPLGCSAAVCQAKPLPIRRGGHLAALVAWPALLLVPHSPPPEPGLNNRAPQVLNMLSCWFEDPDSEAFKRHLPR